MSIRKNKSLYVVLLAVVWFLIGCELSPARFTEEEIKDYPPQIQEKIRRGEVSVGMTRQQVRYALGAPHQVRALDPLNGKAREEWIYTKLFGRIGELAPFIVNILQHIGIHIHRERKILFTDDKLVSVTYR